MSDIERIGFWNRLPNSGKKADKQLGEVAAVIRQMASNSEAKQKLDSAKGRMSNA